MKVHHFAPWKGHFYRLGCVKGLGFKILPDSQRGGHDQRKRPERINEVLKKLAWRRFNPRLRTEA